MRRDGRWLWRALFEELPLPLSWPVYVSQVDAAAYDRFRGRRLPTEAEFHRAWDPWPVGSCPAGASAFGGFPGFEPMPSYPGYSTDFFDGRHYVLKGASPATATELVRRSFRNWYRPHYPYPYAKLRTVAA